jgi:uncharacterized protein (TIGR03000 family)
MFHPRVGPVGNEVTIMTRRGAWAVLVGLLAVGGARAGLFDQGIGSAMYYGPYTGGHGYSYATAYHYMLPFTANGFSSPWVYPYDWSSYPYRGYAFPPRTRFFSTVPPSLEVPVPPGDPQPALVNVEVPPNAEVWIDGAPTTQAGPTRAFQSPPLAAGKTYHYVVRARWKEGGGPVEQVRVVDVQGGQQSRVTFAQR